VHARVVGEKSSGDRNSESIEKRERERKREVSLLTAASKSIQLLLRQIRILSPIGRDLRSKARFLIR